MKLATLLLSVSCVLTVAPAQAQRYSYSTDGSEVTDSQTGLVWRRCIEGMTWSGSTCTGDSRVFNQKEAHDHAKAKVGWRVPNVKELSSIVDRSTIIPAIDVIAFPGTPTTFTQTRTSTLNVRNQSFDSYVDFLDGTVSSTNSFGPYSLRLVKK